jgi:predicted MFS family arabinose efflux permease
VYSLYIPLGFTTGFLLGGWIDQYLGWREAFVIVGVPGVLLALLLRFTLREPARGAAEGSNVGAASASFRATFLHFWHKPSMRHLALGGAVHGIGAWGVAIWVPSFFMRVHGLGSAEVGTWLAVVFGVGGSIGVVAGGRFADHLAGRTGDPRWYPRLAALAVLASLPLGFVIYLAPVSTVALLALFLSILTGHTFLGPVLSMIQGLAGPRRRAQGAAYYLFLANLVSMGLGPLVVGAASDLSQSTDGLRYAILGLVSTTSAWSSFHFTRAARTLRADLAATEVMPS